MLITDQLLLSGTPRLKYEVLAPKREENRGEQPQKALHEKERQPGDAQTGPSSRVFRLMMREVDQ
jgi:hypothetical protein